MSIGKPIRRANRVKAMVVIILQRIFLLLLALFSWYHLGWAQPGGIPGINYRLVPNLQPMENDPVVPDFTLPTLEGKKLSLRDFGGKLILLNFWATWCVSCREEMPTMELLYQEFKHKGFAILAVNVKDKRKDALVFVKELKLTFPVVFDSQGEVGLLYGAWGLPTSYLIGRKGEGLARMWGPADWYSPRARELIRSLLDQKQ